MHPARTPGNVVVVPHAEQPDVDDPVAADAGISAAHGAAGRIHEGQHERGALAVAVLLAGRLHAPLARGGDLGMGRHGHAEHGADPRGRGAQLHHQHPRRSRSSTRPAPIPRLGADVPRWYGETDRLLGPRLADHLDLEHPGLVGARRVRVSRTRCRPSRSTRRTAMRAASSSGSNHEAIFYDPEALAQPIRIIRNYIKIERLRAGRPVRLHRMHPDDLSAERQGDAGFAGRSSSSTRCPTCTAARGRRCGSSTTSRAWRSPPKKISLRSSEQLERNYANESET